MRDGYVSVTGGRIWYGIVGADKSGVPLVILHGGPGAPHDYLEPLAALADERPVIFYDQLGCGNSDKPDDASLWVVERFVEELGQLRTALTLTKVHLLGQSWGAALATEYMLVKQPEGVISLVLSGPLLSASRWIEDQKAYVRQLPEEAQEAIRNAEVSGNFQSTDYQNAMMIFYRRHLCRLDPWPDCLNRAFEKLSYPVYTQMWGPSEFTVTGTLKNFERLDALERITAPTLLTCGEFDEAAPSSVRHYQRHLPGSEVVVIEGASHTHHLEKPDAFLKAVRDFLSRAEKRSR
ncbi:MAG TPA: proline iminopeptidase-family hydrolase [Burkholderiales bacterium]|nr:proline iminopeptidase-family hydrolase [Burkholderiales bacterium]